MKKTDFLIYCLLIVSISFTFYNFSYCPEEKPKSVAELAEKNITKIPIEDSTEFITEHEKNIAQYLKEVKEL